MSVATRTGRAAAAAACCAAALASAAPAANEPEPQVQINGEEDGLAPPALAHAARMRNSRLRTIVLPATGHVELIAPGAAAWNRAVESLNALVH
jgi:pimeloyl-ACP methyl ester carboxylesterase